MFALVADAGVAFGLVLVVVLAGVVAVVVTICLAFKALVRVLCFVFGGMWRAITETAEPGERHKERTPRGAPFCGWFGESAVRSVCKYDGCGHENPLEAVYCARCGRRLRAH